MDTNKLHGIICEAEALGMQYYVLSYKRVTPIHTRDKFGLVQITNEEAELLIAAAKDLRLLGIDGVFDHDVYVGRFRFLALMRHAMTLVSIHDNAIADILAQPWQRGLVRSKREETIVQGDEQPEDNGSDGRAETPNERDVRKSFQYRAQRCADGLQARHHTRANDTWKGYFR